MQQQKLGPNGALVFCMEELLRSAHWLTDSLRSLEAFKTQPYIIIDCPGQVRYFMCVFPWRGDMQGLLGVQVELYSHHDVAQRLLDRVCKELDLRLCAVQLMDSYYCW